MSEQHDLRPESDTWRRERPFVGFDRHGPAQNQLLAALPLANYRRLLPALEPVALPVGRTVHESGDDESYLYFLTAGIVCRFYGPENGSCAGLGITGNEGVIGIASFLGGERSPSQAEVLCAGYAYRLSAAVLKRQFELDGTLPQLLLRYTWALFTQIGQAAACNRHHSLEQRLCRLLLSCRDRLPSNRIALTQRRIAHILGVRREGVTEAAGRLQETGLIHSIRGQLTILDRPGLEAQACECYEVVRRSHDLLLDDYRRIEDAARVPRITRALRDHSANPMVATA
jgi:CRP-like cAMP-binding protein